MERSHAAGAGTLQGELAEDKTTRNSRALAPCTTQLLGQQLNTADVLIFVLDNNILIAACQHDKFGAGQLCGQNHGILAGTIFMVHPE